MIEITPGLISPGVRMTERMESLRHTCPYCQGNGYHWQEDEWQERYKQECPICKGSGRLDAEVTVEWKAHNNSKFIIQNSKLLPDGQ